MPLTVLVWNRTHNVPRCACNFIRKCWAHYVTSHCSVSLHDLGLHSVCWKDCCHCRLCSSMLKCQVSGCFLTGFSNLVILCFGGICFKMSCGYLLCFFLPCFQSLHCAWTGFCHCLCLPPWPCTLGLYSLTHMLHSHGYMFVFSLFLCATLRIVCIARFPVHQSFAV